MRKFVILIVVIVTLLVVCGVTYGAEIIYVGSSAGTGNTGVVISEIEAKVPDEVNMESIMKKTYGTEMFFKGEASVWKVKYLIDKKLIESNEDVKLAKMILATDSKYVGDIWYHIRTTQGYYSANAKIGESGVVEITENCPIPLSDESITITIIYGNLMEKVTLLNNYPKSIISASEALKIGVEEYIKIYKEDPNSTYSFYVELQDNFKWIVSYDDNDEIGGKAYILVDGISGEVSDIKMEE